MERVVHVPRVEVEEREVQVRVFPRLGSSDAWRIPPVQVPKIEYVERVVEVPQIEIVERFIEVPQVRRKRHAQCLSITDGFAHTDRGSRAHHPQGRD